MKKIIFVMLTFALAIFTVACTTQEKPVACTMDAKQCPDGSYVGRVAPSCEFAKCPDVVSSPQDDSNAPPQGKKVVIQCTEEQKKATMCTMEYMPVCGSDGITYGNKCTACAAGIESYTEGECPNENDTIKY